MNFDELFDQIQQGKLKKEEARKYLSMAYLKTAGNYIVDTNRQLRNNIPEIIYAEHKNFEQTIEIAEAILSRHPRVIISRFPENQQLKAYFGAKYSIYAEENIVVVGDLPATKNKVLVITGGSSDHPIATEVAVCLKALGVEPLLFEDRGMAHPTRVIEALETGIKHEVRTAIVIAGMEATLATFVSSMLPLPVIGVPTSVGYGFQAENSSLISMLASCTPNLTVVNTDGGIRAAVVASLIAKG